MLTIYFIRHGQSEANLQGIIQGHAEFPLSSNGVRQAELVGEWLSAVSLDAIMSSDLTRAKVTADKIAKHHQQEVILWEMLREVGLGPLEGKTREQMYDEFPDLKPHDLLTSGIDGTEPVSSITNRCAAILKELTDHYEDQTVAIVSHGGFIGIMLMYVIAGDAWHQLKRPFVIGNTGITKITVDSDNTTKIHFTNQTEHLKNEDVVLHSSHVAY